jgi:excisionase family DNA binding protein
MSEPLWTTADVAHLLAVSEATVGRLIRDESLPVVPLRGRARRFAPAAVRAWVESRLTAQRRGSPAPRFPRPARRRPGVTCPGWDGIKRLKL